MLQLVILNTIIIILSVAFLLFSKKIINNDKRIRILFIVLPLLTVLGHYSSLIYHLFAGISSAQFIIENPNLVLPIYPCNVVMWSLLLLGIFWNKREKRLFRVIIDFCFYFGLVSALVGMFANVDFILNPTLKNFDVTKSIIVHGIMLTNILALAFYKITKVDLHSNFVNLTVGVLIMGVIGLYNNLIVWTIAGDFVNTVNSMFLIHSPFENLPFLTYPVIISLAIPMYFLIFVLIDLIKYKKGNRFIHREFHW